MTELHQLAADLLWILWRGTPSEYKSRYRTTIWQQFEDNVRSAAYTSNLGKFVNSISSRLQIRIRSADETSAHSILNGGNDRRLLKLFREETTLLVLMVRVRNQERRKEWERKEAEHAEEEKALHKLGFGLPMEGEES